MQTFRLHVNLSNGHSSFQPIYEPQNVRQVQQTVVTTTAITHNAPQPSPGQGYPVSPPVAAQQPPVYQEPGPPVAPKKHESSLSNNLSELDTLLQDLSSAQFIAEVDRRNAGELVLSQWSVVCARVTFGLVVAMSQSPCLGD